MLIQCGRSPAEGRWTTAPPHVSADDPEISPSRSPGFVIRLAHAGGLTAEHSENSSSSRGLARRLPLRPPARQDVFRSRGGHDLGHPRLKNAFDTTLVLDPPLAEAESDQLSWRGVASSWKLTVPKTSSSSSKPRRSTSPWPSSPSGPVRMFEVQFGQGTGVSAYGMSRQAERVLPGPLGGAALVLG